MRDSMHCLVSWNTLRCALSFGQCVNMPAKFVQTNVMMVHQNFFYGWRCLSVIHNDKYGREKEYNVAIHRKRDNNENE